MKSKKNIIIGLVILLIVALVSVMYYQKFVNCRPDGQTVCLDQETGMFLIEDNALISVQVPSEEVGNELIATWNAIHPDHSGQVTYIVNEPLDVNDMKNGFPSDIMVTSQKDAVYFMDRFYDFKGPLESLMGSRIPRQFEENINLKGYHFVANAVSGPLFIYNDELGSSLGYQMTEEGFDLPAEFSSFESLITHESKLLESLDVSYPLSFKDQLMIYPLLTSGRWSLSFSRNPDNIGFDSSEFKQGLGLISKMSQMTIDKRLPEGSTAKDLPWQYETAYYHNNALMSFVYDVDFVQEHSQNMKFTPFPRFEDHALSPIAEVFGYVVNGETEFPSAAAEVIRMLRSPEILSKFPYNLSKTLIYDSEFLSEIERDDLNRMYAYRFHRPETLQTLTYNNSILARDVYHEIDILPELIQLYDGTITVDQAQSKIVEKAQVWYETHRKEGES